MHVRKLGYIRAQYQVKDHALLIEVRIALIFSVRNLKFTLPRFRCAVL